MNSDKSAALAKISTINAVEGFDPTPLAVEYADLNTGEKRLRLPVMAQIAWFRLKYPEGRFTLNVTPGKDCFVAAARIYRNYMDPMDCFLSEASASRGYLPDKPTVSPREWAQTAALGIALRNAGFGLRFHAAGESFDDAAVDELGQLIGVAAAGAVAETPPPVSPATGEIGHAVQTNEPLSEQFAEDPLEAAMKIPCPISKYSGKTLGDMMSMDPNALVWVANKFQGDAAISSAAKLICENALAVTA